MGIRVSVCSTCRRIVSVGGMNSSICSGHDLLALGEGGLPYVTGHHEGVDRYDFQKAATNYDAAGVSAWLEAHPTYTGTEDWLAICGTEPVPAAIPEPVDADQG